MTGSGTGGDPVRPAADWTDAEVDPMLSSLLNDGVTGRAGTAGTADAAGAHDAEASGRPPVAWFAAAAAVVTVAAVGAAIAFGPDLRPGSNPSSPPVEPAGTALELSSGNLDPAVVAGLTGAADYSGLTDPASAAACLRANAASLGGPAGVPSAAESDAQMLGLVIGAAPVTLDGEPGQLFLLPPGAFGGTSGGLLVLVTGEQCGGNGESPATADQLLVTRIG